jgi:putative mRNA 3-end processing factor
VVAQIPRPGDLLRLGLDDWPDLCRTIRDTGAEEVWVTHGQEDALVHWCGTQGIRAKPLHLLGYGDDGEAEPAVEAEAAA